MLMEINFMSPKSKFWSYRLLYQRYLHDLDEYTFYSVKKTNFPPVNFNVALQWTFFLGFEVW